MKKSKVADVMTRAVVVAREDTTFKEMARLMAEHRVSGLPVLGSDDRLVGIVSEGDLLATEESTLPRPLRLLGGRWLEPEGDLRARDVMMRDVVTIGPDEPVDAAARALLTNGVKRLPVVEDGKLIGIVSRTDVLRPYLRDDDEIRREVVDEVILDTMWIDPSTIRVTVEGGVVTLEGQVETKGTKEVVVELVRRVDGVVGLEDRVTFVANDRQTNTRPPEMAGFGFGRGKLTGSSYGGSWEG